MLVYRSPSSCTIDMRSTFRIISFIARFGILGLALAFVLTKFAPEAVQYLRTTLGEPAAPALPRTSPAISVPSTSIPTEKGPVSYAEAVARAAPAVVNIYANKIVTARQYRAIPDPITQRLFGSVTLGPLYKKREQSLGSGVIVSTDGYVLTNNHVINGADDIQVLLDGDRVAQAKVVGTDAETDLAVLKIDAKNLPTIAMTERAPANVGDVVLAIGNPFGIGKTVTMGIVSATGRQLKLSAYEDFIQTDAAINAGNSGGALIDALGELVGINTATYRQGAEAEGIGFAIPVTTAKTVLDQIIAHGVVVRGWFGAEYANLPIAIVASGNEETPSHGVIIMQLYASGPGAQAGLQPGDIVLKLDGNAIADQADLRNHEAALPPGTEVTLDGMRGNTPFTVKFTLAQRPPLGRTTGT